MYSNMVRVSGERRDHSKAASQRDVEVRIAFYFGVPENHTDSF